MWNEQVQRMCCPYIHEGLSDITIHDGALRIHLTSHHLVILEYLSPDLDAANPHSQFKGRRPTGIDCPPASAQHIAGLTD